MAVDFESLMARQTIADIRTSMIAACEAVDFLVSRLPILSRLRKLALDAVPVIVHTATEVNAEAIRGGLLDYASGVWLELLAINLYGIEAGRIAETFATTPVTFTNTSNSPYNFADGEVIVGNGMVTYTVPAFELAAVGNDGDEITVDVTATVAGSSGSTAAATITEMVTTFNGVACTNASAASGTDEETDTQLRARCKLSRAALSNAGPVDAIRFVALSATYEDGTACGVTRVQVVENGTSIGDVAVYLADADGGVSEEARVRVDHLLRTLVIPSGVNYIGTFAATAVAVPVTYAGRYKVSAGFSTETLEEMVSEALTDMFAEHPIGGYIETSTEPDGSMYQSDIETTIACVVGEAGTERPIKKATVSAPAADVVLEPGEVATLGLITPTWVEV
jgi:uncharacterized phage protein gp47/JayE